MKQLKKFLKNIWKDESAQGATEYILLLVIVMALAFLFKGKIMEIVEAKLGDISRDISGFQSQ